MLLKTFFSSSWTFAGALTVFCISLVIEEVLRFRNRLHASSFQLAHFLDVLIIVQADVHGNCHTYDGHRHGAQTQISSCDEANEEEGCNVGLPHGLEQDSKAQSRQNVAGSLESGKNHLGDAVDHCTDSVAAQQHGKEGNDGKDRGVHQGEDNVQVQSLFGLILIQQTVVPLHHGGAEQLEHLISVGCQQADGHCQSNCHAGGLAGLAADVVDHCNQIAKKYGYDGLEFVVSNVKKDKLYNNKIDMVISLYACDTTTDYALNFAINNNVKYIFSVPCCQHEINLSISKAGDFDIMLKDGLIKERFSALLTDAIRTEVLRAVGYSVDVIEFVDFAHSPKNIMLRATKNSTKKSYQSLLDLQNKYKFNQTLLSLQCEQK